MTLHTFRPAHWLLATTLAAASLSSLAQPAPAPAPAAPAAQVPGGRMAEMHERMQARQARHLQELKSSLQLTAAQEGAWSQFTAALQARPAPGAAHAAHEELQRLSTPERIDRMKTLRAQHQAEMNAFMDRRGEATKTLYAALTPEQKKTFDAHTARFMGGHEAGRGRHEHGHAEHGQGHRHAHGHGMQHGSPR